MKKTLIVIIIALSVIVLVLAGMLIYQEIDARQTPPLLLASEEEAAYISPLPSTTPSAMEGDAQLNSVSEPFETPEASPTPKPSPDAAQVIQLAVGEFAIKIKNKTYQVKKGVDEATLKKHIGWMQSSANPGAEGTCALFGHRNTQFRILKDVVKGDPITITDAHGNDYAYTVQSAKVIAGDNALSFPAHDGKALMLITCYPFYFQGHAPDKYVVYAFMQ